MTATIVSLQEYPHDYDVWDPDHVCMVHFLLGFPCSTESMHDPEPTLGMAIWLLRHGIEPFTSDSIDWIDLIEEESNSEEDSTFYMQALTSAFFGPANYETYL